MKFVETPSFWCPHVDRAACNNFSTRTVKLRSSERREILPFFFSYFLSILRTPFYFFVFFVFFPFLLFFIPFSHFIFSFLLLILFFSFSLLFWHFLLPFGAYLTEWSREETSSPFPHATCAVHDFRPYFLISLFPFYCIILHVANYEPHIQVHHMPLAMCHSLGVPCVIPLTMPWAPCVIRHPIPRKMCNSDCLGIR